MGDPTADFEQNLRGRLIRPGDADYDAARALYNGMIDKRPRLIARCVGRRRRHRRGELRPRAGSARRDPRRRPQRPRPRQLRRRAGDRPVDDEERARRSRRAGTVRVDAGCTSGDVDHATHAVRPGRALRHRLDDRRRRPDARRRHRVSHAQVRPHDRQPARGRRRPGRRQLRHRQQETSIPICSGRCAAAAATSAS